MNMKTRKLIEYIIAKIKDLVSYFFYYFLVLYFVVIGLLLKTPGFNAEASAKLQFYVGMCFIFPFLLGFLFYLLELFWRKDTLECPRWLSEFLADILCIAFFFNLYLLYVYS